MEIVLYFMAVLMTFEGHSSRGCKGCSKTNNKTDFVAIKCR